jgi:4-aminobutyrate aminotransferase-like enzyme
MMGANAAQKEWIGYLDPNIHHLPFPYPWRPEAVRDPRGYFRRGMEKLLEEQRLDPQKDLCGFIFETFQGWGAVFYPVEFVQEVVAFARQHKALVAFDEMQSGFGRTGKLFGYMHYEVEPDLLCCGKGAGSGFPVSLVLGPAAILDLPDVGSMSSTHSANPLACAAALGSLRAILEDGLLENSRDLGELFHRRLAAIRERFPEAIRYTLGKGLLASLIFMDGEGRPLTSTCDRVSEEAMRRGLLVVHTGRESIKLAPPLCITEEPLLEGLSVLEDCIAAALSS